MRKVGLIFPDTCSLADFVFKYGIRHADVTSGDKTLTANLSDQQIVVACTAYEAELKPQYFFEVFEAPKELDVKAQRRDPRNSSRSKKR